MKKNILLLFLLLILFSNSLHATDMSSFFGDMQDALEDNIKTMYFPIKSAAQYIFYSLAVFELVFVFGLMAVKGELELGGIWAQLIKIMMIIGLFNMFFAKPEWMTAIFNGFNDLADRTNGGTTPSLDAVMDNIGSFWGDVVKQISKNGLTGVGDSLLLLSFSIIATIFISLMVGRAMQYYVFFLFSLYVGVFWFAFSSWSYTRAWAYNAVVNIIRQGAKWMMMMLTIGVMFALINDAISIGIEHFITLFSLAVISIIMYGFSVGIDSWVDSYFTGHGGGENNHAGQMLKSMGIGAAAGAIGGAAAGLSQVKAAAAAGEMAGASGGGGSNIPGSPGGGSSTENTAKSGNFINTAKAATKNVSAVSLGAIGG
ncbi:MAG TPA: hypothetical protein EYH01_09755, partial [Campylobacterales bacterium]|nr:hypothetical protein [Campylobacterales bacterium]